MGVGGANNDPALLQEALATGRFVEAVTIFERSYGVMNILWIEAGLWWAGIDQRWGSILLPANR